MWSLNGEGSGNTRQLYFEINGVASPMFNTDTTNPDRIFMPRQAVHDVEWSFSNSQLNSITSNKFDVRIRASNAVWGVGPISLLDKNGDVLGTSTYSTQDANGVWSAFIPNCEYTKSEDPDEPIIPDEPEVHNPWLPGWIEEDNGYPEELQTLNKQYLLYASGKKSMQLHASNVRIDGNLYTGGNLDAYSGRVDVYGRAQIVGQLKKHKYTNFNRLQFMEKSLPRYYTDLSQALTDSLGNNYVTHNQWQDYSNTNVTNNSPIYAKNGLQFTASTATLQDTIISENYLMISASNALNTVEDGEMNLYCKNGNIGIYVGSADINGIIYAPNGTVQICGSDININGVIIAKEILISAENFTINENYDLALAEHIPNGKVEISLEQDSDEDGLQDYFEVLEYETDPFEADTDNDGLDDGLEVVLEYNPLSKDTDGNGIEDGDEDFDGDGLINIDEVYYGTDLTLTDTDGDGLTDGDEVHVYGTDPTNPDTDGDIILDGDEIKIFNEFGIYLDPLNPITDGITPDGQRILPQQNISNDELTSFNADNEYVLSLTVNAAGWASNSTSVEHSGFSYIESTNQAVLGKVVTLNYTDGLKVDNATINFEIPTSVLNSPRYFANSGELAGINRYAIFHWFDEYNMMLPVDAKYNGDTLTVTTEKLGDYFVVDLDRFYHDMGITPNSNSNQSIQSQTRFSPFSFNSFDFELDNSDEIMYNEEGQNEGVSMEELEEIFDFSEPFSVTPKNESDDDLKVDSSTSNNPFAPISPFSPFNTFSNNGFSTYSSNFNPEPNSMGAVDVVFLIDCTDNLGNNFNNVKNNIKSAGTEIFSMSTSARVKIISFWSSATPVESSWLTSTSNLNSYVNGIEQNTNTGNSLFGEALSRSSNATFRQNAGRFAFLIFDEYSQSSVDLVNGQDLVIPQTVQRLIDREVNFSVLYNQNRSEIGHNLITLIEETNGYDGQNKNGNGASGSDKTTQTLSSFYKDITEHIYGYTEEYDEEPIEPEEPPVPPTPNYPHVKVSGRITLGDFSGPGNGYVAIGSHTGNPGDIIAKNDDNQHSDNDGISDSDEVDWNNLIAPALFSSSQEYVCQSFADISRNPLISWSLPSFNHSYISMIRVLPIFSNPWDEDSDGDTVPDQEDPLKLERGISRRMSLSYKEQLYSEIDAQIKNDFSWIMQNKNFGYYSTKDCIDILYKYDKLATSLSNQYLLPKALIQSVLLRELRCLDARDSLADAWVSDLFFYYALVEIYENEDWLYKLIVGFPEVPIPSRDDSSVGLGQIFAKTAIRANNWAVNSGIKSGKNYDWGNWKEREEIWNQLKNDDDYSISMVALVLMWGAAGGLKEDGTFDSESVLHSSYWKYNENELKTILSRYQGAALYENVTYNYYGEMTYNTYVIFDRFNASDLN